MNKERVCKTINGEDYYFCNKCKRWRPKSKFNIDRSSLHGNRGGLCSECKDCLRERYYKERLKLFEDDNWALRYKLLQALKGTKRRSKEKNIYNDLTIDYLMYLWEKQNGKCALTGIQMTYKFYEGRVNTNLSVDRIDSTKGYSKDNVQLVCMAANQMKNDLSMEEFVEMCEAVLAHAYQYYGTDVPRKWGVLNKLESLPGDIKIKGKSGYKRFGNLEFNAHSIIEPMFNTYLTNKDIYYSDIKSMIDNMYDPKNRDFYFHEIKPGGPKAGMIKTFDAF